jgi:hypothetical protein
VRNRDSNQWEELQGFGLYPDEPGKAVYGTVPGNIVREAAQSLNSADNGLAVAVTRQMYEYALTNTLALRRANVPYNLFTQSCVDFTEEAARAIGLKTPDASGLANRPQAFIDRLKALND